ncbi:MAG: hypothetical protein ACLFPU_07645, partial [Dehalococcoidia bacterium]
MVTGPSFKLGIVDPDSVSRAGIRWILREKEILEDFSVTWEAEGYGEALTECERSCPDLVIISVQYYTHNLVSFIQDLPHRFSTILTLLIAPPPDDLNV